MATRKLTPALLRRIVKEERARIVAEAKKKEAKKKEAKKMKEADGEISSDADELGADEFGSDKSLVNPVDHAKAAGIKNEAAKLEKLVIIEKRLARLQRMVRESKTVTRRKIIRAAR
jgi:hypothetical protein